MEALCLAKEARKRLFLLSGTSSGSAPAGTGGRRMKRYGTLEGRVRCGLMAIVGGCEGLVSLFIQQRVELSGVGNLHLE
jgi:hypothetical protein